MSPLPEVLKGLQTFIPCRDRMLANQFGDYVKLADVIDALQKEVDRAWSDWFVWVCPTCAEQFEYGPDGEPVEPCSHISDCLDADRVQVAPLYDRSELSESSEAAGGGPGEPATDERSEDKSAPPTHLEEQR